MTGLCATNLILRNTWFIPCLGEKSSATHNPRVFYSEVWAPTISHIAVSKRTNQFVYPYYLISHSGGSTDKFPLLWYYQCNNRFSGSITKQLKFGCELIVILCSVPQQTTVWLQRNPGPAAVPFLAGIITLPQRNVRSSSLGAAGRISTTISPRMSAPPPATALVFTLCCYTYLCITILLQTHKWLEMQPEFI